MILPGPSETETIRTFLQESCGLFIEHVEFGKPAAGLSIRAHYRDMRGHSGQKAVLFPDARSRGDLEDAVVALSEMLDHEAGVQPKRLVRQ